MAGFAFQPPDRPEDVLPAYLFSGADLFPARKFVRELRDTLKDEQGQPAQIETFNLADRRFGDVLDAAKTLPFMFSPWRILVVEGKGAGQEGLSSGEAAALAEYFASPAPRTTIVVMFLGTVHKTKPLGKAFFALPESVVRIAEIYPLKDKDLKPLVAARFEARGKRVTPDAVDKHPRHHRKRRRPDRFRGRKALSLSRPTDDSRSRGRDGSFDDEKLPKLGVDRRSGSRGDRKGPGRLKQPVRKRGGARADPGRPFRIFPRTFSWPRPGSARAAILRTFSGKPSPRFRKNSADFTRRMLGEYLGLLGRIKDADLLRRLTELEDMDRRLKSTDVSPREMIQAFIVSFGRTAGGRRVTSPRRA